MPKEEKQEKRMGTFAFRPQVMAIIFALFVVAIGCLGFLAYNPDGNGVRDAVVGVMGVAVGGLVVIAGNLIREA